MSDLKLGQLIVDSKQDRDAIHVAVAPAVAASMLLRGDHVGFVDKENGLVAVTSRPIGIVDPFLMQPVQKGQRFWLFLYPNSVTGMRHHWEHPAFGADGVASTSPSEKWLRDWAERNDMTYSFLMDSAKTFVDDGEYIVQGGRFEGVKADDEFWSHYEKATGTKVGKEERGGIFSCSC